MKPAIVVEPFPIEKADGSTWFVLTDVCRALALVNPSVAAKPLAEDERSMFNIGSRSGEAIIATESGETVQ